LVCSVHPVENTNAARRRDRYELDPREVLRLDKLAESREQEMVGFYHSHPDHPARPSATDATHAWPGYVYLIVGVSGDGDTETRAWLYDDKSQLFRESPVQVEGSVNDG
jgi:proteasome lid subunit RPN8/RPN11